jgi:hypothetical protein
MIVGGFQVMQDTIDINVLEENTALKMEAVYSSK